MQISVIFYSEYLEYSEFFCNFAADFGRKVEICITKVTKITIKYV